MTGFLLRGISIPITIGSMIEFVVGARSDLSSYIDKLIEREGFNRDHITKLYSQNFEQDLFQNLVPVHAGLFGEKEFFIIYESVRSLDLAALIDEYSLSDHYIIFYEESLLKKDKNILEKNKIPVREFEKKQKLNKKQFNTFLLADLFGERKKKELWLSFQQAIQNVSPEEIHGILFWQLKNLVLVKTSTVNPGMNNFVYTKNKAFIKNYSLEELQKYSLTLLKMFHMRDVYNTLEIDLEKFILDL